MIDLSVKFFFSNEIKSSLLREMIFFNFLVLFFTMSINLFITTGDYSRSTHSVHTEIIIMRYIGLATK